MVNKRHGIYGCDVSKSEKKFKIIHYLSWKTCLQEKTGWLSSLLYAFSFICKILANNNTLSKSLIITWKDYVLVIFKNRVCITKLFSWSNPLNLGDYFYQYGFQLDSKTRSDFSFLALGFAQIHEKETFPSWLRPKGRGDCIYLTIVTWPNIYEHWRWLRELYSVKLGNKCFEEIVLCHEVKTMFGYTFWSIYN